MTDRDYTALEKRLGYRFQDTGLLDLALTHPSYAVEQHLPDNNQRLEFLGDAVLEVRVSEVLYHRFTRLHEGQLTRRRASLVREENLARAAREIGLGAWLHLPRGEEREGLRDRASVLCDTMEAVIAAVYLDGGYQRAASLIDRALEDYTQGDEDVRDAKSRLQELLQKWGEPAPAYEIVSETGAPNARVFTAQVRRGDGTLLGEGSGTRKQRAQEAAAEVALGVLMAAGEEKTGK